MVPLIDRRFLLQFIYPRWKSLDKSLEAGYSILMPMPSDLPVIYRAAMSVLARQRLRNVNEIIIVPDVYRRGFSEIVLYIESYRYAQR
jgi:hypothetical protein